MYRPTQNKLQYSAVVMKKNVTPCNGVAHCWFGLCKGFGDNKRNVEYRQPYPLMGEKLWFSCV